MLTQYVVDESMGTRRTLVRDTGRELKVRILLDGLTLVMLQFDEDASKSYGGSITDRLLEIEAESPA